MTIIEKYREDAVKSLFQIKSFGDSLDKWTDEMKKFLSVPSPKEIFDLADHMKEIFETTNTEGRSQRGLSKSGACWEAFVCWYLNLCLIESNTVVIKHSKKLIPNCIANAITVNYGNISSNTESDLIAITFPDLPVYTVDMDELDNQSFGAVNNKPEHMIKLNNKKTNYMKLINAMFEIRDFSKLEVHIIQCKTNWNDNAQIPMLWDIVYSSQGFNNGVKIGKEGYSINQLKKFTYSFVTVPTTNPKKIQLGSVCVSRVRNLSGGNYWGKASEDGIAQSLKEIINRNFFSDSCLEKISNGLKELYEGKYSYFKFPRP